MKRMVAIISGCVLLLSLTACSTQENLSETDRESISSDSQSNITMVEDSVWPDNEYTEGLPVPNGTVVWVMVDSENEYCCINVDNIGQGEFDEYIQALTDLGFNEIESTSEVIDRENYVSIGTIYSNGKKSLSIAYADANFVINIFKENN